MLLDYGEWSPEVASPVFIAPGSYIIGQVVLEEHASVWFNAVIRGDTDLIRLGARSNLQDNAVLHADRGRPCLIGHDVTLGHRVVVHGADISHHVLVGMGSIVMNGARIGPYCLIGAGSLVTENTVIEEGQLVLGSPARAVRALTTAERQSIEAGAAHYVELWLKAGWHFH